ncbi:MAG: VOC family protein [Pseudomonadota bacterium]
MRSTQFYPVIQTNDVAKTVAFYIENLRFTAAFDSDWYCHLQSLEDEKVNVAVLRADHETIPGDNHGAVNGLILNFEVEDVDAEYARLKARGLPIVKSLRDEPFGQRHFMTQDPNGVLIDVITPIPPSAEFLAQYAPAAVPQ